ncbi:MAG: PilZ domain-containing protein [Acidobacteria bacterium]|nr:PilZ domain-containing protein [Acidobacteriota bacterium]
MSDTNRSFYDELKTYITINDVLQVRLMDEPTSATYYSRIDDISEGKLIIAWPTNAGIRLILHRDQILDFYFIREGTPHMFSGLVDDTRTEPMPQIIIILSSAVSQVQRRQNFRVKCLIPVEIVGNIKEDPRSDETTALTVKTVSNDLSASGISVRYAKRIPEGSIVNIKLSLPDEGPPISIPCSIIYSEYLTENQILYRTGFRYLMISEAERARIVRYVYRTQLQGLHP